MAKGPLATFAAREMDEGSGFGLTSFGEAEDYFQMKMVMGEHEEERNRSQLFWGQKCRDAHAVLRITSVFLASKRRVGALEVLSSTL